MRSSSAALLALTTSRALAQSVVQFELNKLLPGIHLGMPPAVGRRAFYTEDVANNLTGGGYYATVSVGSPGQDMTMVLDTGSSDVWVVSYKADLCTSARLQAYYMDSCGATYNPNKSTTYQPVDPGGFSITYLDGGGAEGDYISDDFSIAGVTVKSLQMGYGTAISRGTGIIGVGFPGNEAASTQYPNIIDLLVSQGDISTRAYSLYLNDLRSSSGSILFGGIDTDKFIGPLSVLPILKTPSQTNYTAFQVALNGMSAGFKNGSSVSIPATQKNLPAILDSGTTLSYLPDDMATDLFDAVGAYTDNSVTGFTFVDCKYLDDSADTFSINFTFTSGVQLAVPAEEMILDVLDGVAGSLPKSIPFSDPCLFGIQSSGSASSKRSEHLRRQTANGNFALLGDTFLRSAYVVYDLANAQIGIAPANLNSTDTKITELTGDKTALASFSGVASQQTTATPTPTNAASGGAGSSSPTGTSDGGQVTVTVTTGAQPKNNAGQDTRVPAFELFAVASVTGVFVLLGGLML